MGNNKKIIILYSGGLDSFVLYHWTKKKYPNCEIKCIYYDYGNPVCRTEISKLPEFVTVKNIDWFDNSTEKLVGKKEEDHKGNIYIPGRNMVFAVLTAAQELPDYIFMGGLYEEAHNAATDKNVKFINKFNDLVNYVLSPFKDKISLIFPFVDELYTKSMVIDWALNNGIQPDILGKLYSCFNYSENGLPCGECHSCMRSFSFFYKKGIPIKFSRHPFFESDFGINYLNNSIQMLEESNYDRVLLQDLDYSSIRSFLTDYNINQSLVNRINKFLEI